MPPPRPPKLDFSQIPSKSEVFLEVKTPEMVTFGGGEKNISSSAGILQTPTQNPFSTKMVSPIVVTTPSEADLGVMNI